MANPTVNLSAVPTGGAIMLDLPDYVSPPSGVTDITISIATSGSSGLSAFTGVYSGPPIPKYLDVGDIYPGPLNPTAQYVYQVQDSRGTTQAGPITPAWAIATLPDQLSQIFIRLLQGAVNSMPYPVNLQAPLGTTGTQRPQVTTQMPANGLQAMPFIVVNLDLVQQHEVAIGEDVAIPNTDNNWTLFAMAKRLWRVTVMCQSADERDFLRDSLMSAFRAFKAYAFSPLGYNVRHSFQANSYTDVHEWEGHSPGFYGADIMLEIDGVFPVTILTDYGLIGAFDVAMSTQASGSAYATTSAIVPSPSGVA